MGTYASRGRIRLYLVMALCAALFLVIPALWGSAAASAEGDGGAVEPVRNPRINMLVRPVFGCPAVRARGESLRLRFDTTAWGEREPAAASGWGVSLVTSDDPVPLVVELEVDSWWEEAPGIYEVEAVIPPETPEDLYDLQVECRTAEGILADSQPNAVQVVAGFDDDLTLINLTDTQVGDILSVFNNPAESTPNWWPSAGTEDLWKHLRKAVEEINLIHPDLLVMSGDIVYGQLYFGEYPLEYPLAHDILQELDVPVFIVPGNHDNYRQAECDGEMYFQRYFGPLHYSFDYGPFHFTAVDTYDWPLLDRSGYGLLVSTWGGQVREEQLAWLAEDLASHADSLMRILVCHHSPDDPSDWKESWWIMHDRAEYPFPQLYMRLFFGLLGDQAWMGDGREEMLELLDEGKVDLLLAGHVHYDRIARDVNDYGTDILVTTAGCFDVKAGSAYAGFRMVVIEDGRVTSDSYQGDYSIPIYRNGYPPADNLKQQTEPSVTASFLHPNDGSSDRNVLTVENRLLAALPVYVEFTLPRGEYRVEGGEVFQVSERGDYVVLYVRSSVPGGATTEVSVEPAV
jgi:3',5'-cyclic AMP phosphodiesterase CpdA